MQPAVFCVLGAASVFEKILPFTSFPVVVQWSMVLHAPTPLQFLVCGPPQKTPICWKPRCTPKPHVCLFRPLHCFNKFHVQQRTDCLFSRHSFCDPPVPRDPLDLQGFRWFGNLGTICVLYALGPGVPHRHWEPVEAMGIGVLPQVGLPHT